MHIFPPTWTSHVFNMCLRYVSIHISKPRVCTVPFKAKPPSEITHGLYDRKKWQTPAWRLLECYQWRPSTRVIDDRWRCCFNLRSDQMKYDPTKRSVKRLETMGLLFTFRIGVVKSQVAISSELFGLALSFKFSSIDTGIPKTAARWGSGNSKIQANWFHMALVTWMQRKE